MIKNKKDRAASARRNSRVMKILAIPALVVFMFIGLGVHAAGGSKASVKFGAASMAMFGFGAFRSPSADEPGGGAKSEEEKLLGKIKSQIEEAMKDGASKKELKALEDQLKAFEEKLKEKGGDPDGYKALKEEHVELMAQVKAMKEGGSEVKGKSIRDQIKSFLENNKEKFESFKKGESKAFEIPLDLKAAGTMLVSGNLGGSAYLPVREITPGFTDLARNAPFVEQYVNSSPTSSANIVWVNKVNPDGNAAMTAEGALKSQIDFDFQTETSTAKKVTDFIKISTEMLDDIDFIAAAIENELRYQIDIKVDEQLLSGDGTGQNLKGITAYAGGYVLTTVNTTTPNNADAIIAAKTQIESLNFMPNYAFVNPIDKANMKLTKTTTGERLVSLNTDEDTGVNVIASNQIPVGYVLVADMSKYIKRDYKPFSIAYGWENQDFTKNLVTVLAERRLHAYASNNNIGAFVYDTFDNIKTALALP